MVRNRAVRGGDLPAQRPLGNAVQAGGTRGAAIPFPVDFTYAKYKSQKRAPAFAGTRLFILYSEGLLAALLDLFQF